MITDDFERSRYLEEGARRAATLGNRGPLRLAPDGALDPAVLEAYWRTGFYVFEAVLEKEELHELVNEFESVLTRAPTGSGSVVDVQGRPAIGAEFERPSFKFARPLSDPKGGTSETGGRYQVKMAEPAPPENAPAEVVLQLSGVLQLMDSALRLYGHPRLLAVAENINGTDFTPFTDTIWVKPPGLGASVSWHQDGTTHWDSADLDAGTHGFNFMTQLYDTTPANSLWVVPGTHGEGRIDIRAKLAEHGSDRFPDAVPMLCGAGDIAMCNRQVLHGSFANTSPDPRATLVFGFHRRRSVLGFRGWAPEPFDAARIATRCGIINLAIDARHQRYPNEQPYAYLPSQQGNEPLRWNETARSDVLANYNLNDLGI